MLISVLFSVRVGIVDVTKYKMKVGKHRNMSTCRYTLSYRFDIFGILIGLFIAQDLKKPGNRAYLQNVTCAF